MDKILYSYCRYYKGEKKCPYEDQNKKLLWQYEQTWVNLQSDNDESLSDNIEFYIGSGLTDFEDMDDTPISLKAFLWNRFASWNGAYVNDFKDWYKESYKGEQ